MARKKRNAVALPAALDPIRTVRLVGRLVRRAIASPGAPPGTLVHTGPVADHPVKVRVLSYGESDVATDREEEALAGIEAAIAASPGPDGSTGVTWVDIEGVHDSSLMEAIRERTGIHPLVLEDVMAVGQRPKLEEYDDYLFVVLRMLAWDEQEGLVREEQVSIVLSEGRLLTFRENPGDLFLPIRDRIRAGKGRIRRCGADYLAYALVDALVDAYFGVLERLGERLEQVEEEIVRHPAPHLMREIRLLKRELLILRRSVWPLREVLGEMERGDSDLVAAETRVYIRDVYDHVVHVMDTVDALRDITAGTLDLYVSNLTHRTNEVMKVLTVIASIFIPLSFIAGVYGMNFEVMPELGWSWGYPAVLGLMLLVGLGMLTYFKLKDWV